MLAAHVRPWDLAQECQDKKKTNNKALSRITDPQTFNTTPWKCSISALSNMVATCHMWLLSAENVTSKSEKIFHLFHIENVSSHVLMVTILHSDFCVNCFYRLARHWRSHGNKSCLAPQEATGGVSGLVSCLRKVITHDSERKNSGKGWWPGAAFPTVGKERWPVHRGDLEYHFHIQNRKVCRYLFFKMIIPRIMLAIREPCKRRQGWCFSALGKKTSWLTMGKKTDKGKYRTKDEQSLRQRRGQKNLSWEIIKSVQDSVGIKMISSH